MYSSLDASALRRPSVSACAPIAPAHADTSRSTLLKTNLAGSRATGLMHARPKWTMASAAWCAAATSSTQHDPKVVSARTNTRVGTASPLVVAASGATHRRSSAAARLTASWRRSSGI